MGRINIEQSKNAVRTVYAIARDPERLDAFNHRARGVLRETGHLPQTKPWDYIRYRRDLAPARFDAHHPVWGRLLRREERWERQHQPAPSIPPLEPGQPLVPVDCPPPVGPVPEPPGLVMALMAVGVVVLLRRWLS